MTTDGIWQAAIHIGIRVGVHWHPLSKHGRLKCSPKAIIECSAGLTVRARVVCECRIEVGFPKGAKHSRSALQS